jgi:hypothetical protein
MSTTEQPSVRDQMPEDLCDLVAGMIEPTTMACYVDHGDVMDCIGIAYPLIRHYILSHMEA